VLVDTELLAAGEQRQARLQGDCVAGFVDGTGQALDEAIELTVCQG
jgi:hypothetical protein